MPFRSRGIAALVLLVLSTVVLGGCLPAHKARVDVSDLEAMFPELEQLSVTAYMLETSPDCELFMYARGAFSANLDDEFCGWVQGHPPPSSLAAFDQRARDDLTTLKGAFAERDIPISLAFITRGSDGGIRRATFAADRCVYYEYQSAWRSLPEAEKNETVTPIDANWWKRDDCP